MNSRTNLPHHNSPVSSHPFSKLLIVICLISATVCIGSMHQAQADEAESSGYGVIDFGDFDTSAYEVTPSGSPAVEAPQIKTEWNAHFPYYVVGAEPGDPLDLSSATPGAVVYYTTDGTSPVESQGKLSAAAIKYSTTDVIAETTTYRVVAVTGCNESAKTFDAQSDEKRIFVHADNLAISPYVLTDDDETQQAQAVSGSWERVKYSDLSAAMTAKPNSLPYCYKAQAGKTELRSTVLQPVISGSSALSLTVWRSSSYGANDMVTPTITAAAQSPETQKTDILKTSIPLKTASGEPDGWYTYYFGAADYINSSVYCGVMTTSTQPVYLDDLYTAIMWYPTPVWTVFADQATHTQKLKLQDVRQAPANAAKLQYASTVDATGDAKTLCMQPLSDLINYPTATSLTLYYGQYTVDGNYGRSALATKFLGLPYCDAATFSLNGTSIEASSDITDPTMCDFGSKVELATEQTDATIYYTTDGSMPTTDSRVYNPGESLSVGDSLCITALAYADGHESVTSRACFGAYPGPCVEADGEQSIPGVVRPGTAVSLKMTPSYDDQSNPRPMDGYGIYYTTDGTEPSIDDAGIIHGTRYDGPLAIDDDVTITARALKLGAASGVAVAFPYQVTGAADSFEPNDTQDTAASISFPFQVQGTIDITSDVDYYRFTTESNGTYTFTLTNPADQQYTVELYAADGTKIAAGQGSPETSAIVETNFTPGTYFLKVYTTAGSCVSPYTLLAAKNIDAGVAPLNFSESSMAAHILGSKTTQSFTRKNGINGFGNAEKATAYFARWDGPVDEAVEPYNGKEFVDPITCQIPLESATNFPLYDRATHSENYHLDSTLCISKDLPANVRNATLKSAIMNYGAAIVLMGWSQDSLDPTNTFYYQKDMPQGVAGHVVTAVGWDDTIPAEKFEKNGVKPGQDGAFIIKNSYGEQYGDGGFFYLSYDNGSTFLDDASVVVLSSTDDANVLYQHDPLGFNAFRPLSGGVGYVKNVFTASSDQTLSSVSFFTTTSLTDYDIYVQVGSDPEMHVASGCRSMAGYCTANLSSVVEVGQGETFSVTVRERKRDNSPISLAVQKADSEAPNAARFANEGFSYFSEDGVNWNDLYNYDKSVACVKVQAIDASAGSSVVVTPETTDVTLLATLDAQQNNLAQQMSAGDAAAAPIDVPASENPIGSDISDAPYDSTAADADMPVFETPARFDLRDIDGSGTSAAGVVQNQGANQTCWCFGACASAESVLMRRDSFTPTSNFTITAGSNQVIHLTESNPTPTVSLNAKLISTGSDQAANDYISWTYTGDLDGVSVLSYSSNSGEDSDVLTVSQPGTITAEATSAANVLKTAQTTITVIDDRDAGDDGGVDDDTADAGSDKVIPASSKTADTVNAKASAATGDRPLTAILVLMALAAATTITACKCRRKNV